MQKKTDTPRLYRAFLLRCWQEYGSALDTQPLWRFTLEEVGRPNSKRGFGSLEALITLLTAELQGSGNASADLHDRDA